MVYLPWAEHIPESVYLAVWVLFGLFALIVCFVEARKK